MVETLANGYSFESTQRELSNEYQYDRVSMINTNLNLLVLWMKEASAVEGLNPFVHRDVLVDYLFPDCCWCCMVIL